MSQTRLAIKLLEAAAEKPDVQHYDNQNEINTMQKRVQKLLFYQEREMGTQHQIYFAGMKEKMRAVKYLQIGAKVPKADRQDVKTLQSDLLMIGKQQNKRCFFVPLHLKCPITGDLFSEPAMLTSGRTYEQDSIEKYLKRQRYIMEQEKEELDSEEFDDDSYFLCPVSRQKVKDDVIIPNKRTKLAAEAFVKANVWAFEFSAKDDHLTKIPKPTLS